ncbi:MAG: PAS domain S-box protein [Burkholderiaceae bacterium]
MGRDEIWLESVIRSAMDAIIVLDGLIRLFNEAAEVIFGCQACEVIGGPLDRFLPPGPRAHPERWIRDFGHDAPGNRLVGGCARPVGGAARGRRRVSDPGVYLHVEVEGEEYYTVILRDLTEQVAAEQSLR